MFASERLTGALLDRLTHHVHFLEMNGGSYRLYMVDRNYLVQTFDLSGNLTNGGLFGLVEQYYGRPRMYGVTLSTTF